MSNDILKQGGELLADLCHIIDKTKQRVATTVNNSITLMYWSVGNRVNTEVLENERAEYGKQIVVTVSQQLQEKQGKKGFDLRNIRRMMKFAMVFPDFQIVATLSP